MLHKSQQLQAYAGISQIQIWHALLLLASYSIPEMPLPIPVPVTAI